MKDYIIAISREYGSGGRDVGKILAEELGLKYFDNEIMHMAAEKSGMCEDFIEKSSERVPNNFLLNIFRMSLSKPVFGIHSGFNSHVAATSTYEKLNSDKLFQVQSSIIREIAEQGRCVIVGRCAAYVLRDNPNLISVFIRGAFEDRVKRAVETYDRTEKDAAEDVKMIDKHRANYYKTYTNRQWGATDNYDLMVNTSCTGMYGAASVVKAAVDARTAKNKETM